MTRGPWKYQKADGHHHVLFPNGEVLDVQNESDARLIALVPDMIRAIWVAYAMGSESKLLEKMVDKINKISCTR